MNAASGRNKRRNDWTLRAIAIALLMSLSASAEETEKEKARPLFDTHWVVIMELGEKAADMDSETKTKLRREHLRYLSEFEETGEVLVSSGFRVHHDERHRELAFYRSDLDRTKVEEIANGTPIVEAGLWKPYVYAWPTAGGDVSFKAEED